MNQSTRKISAKSTDEDLTAFIARKAEIDEMLSRLQALSDDHFGCAPDEVTWADVGTLGHYAELLKRITDMAATDAALVPPRRHARRLLLPFTAPLRCRSPTAQDGPGGYQNRPPLCGWLHNFK